VTPSLYTVDEDFEDAAMIAENLAAADFSDIEKLFG
jgi:hypothetical protein